MAIAKNLSFYMNGVSLANAINSFSPTSSSEVIDVTAIAHVAREKEVSFKNGVMQGEGYFKYDQTNLDEIHNVMSAAFGNGAEAVVSASLEALAIGGTAILLNPTQQEYSVRTPLGQAISVGFNLESNNGIGFGKWLFNASVNNTTTNGTSVDNGTSSARGGLFHAQIQNPNELAGSIKLQHSTDNSVWVDLATLNLTGTGTRFEGLSATVAGTINRYTRAVATATGGTITFQAALARR